MRSKIFKPVPKNFWKHRRFKLMAFLRQSEEKNNDDYLYGKSGDEDDRLRKEYLYFSFSTHGRADLCVERLG